MQGSHRQRAGRGREGGGQEGRGGGGEDRRGRGGAKRGRQGLGQGRGKEEDEWATGGKGERRGTTGRSGERGVLENAAPWVCRVGRLRRKGGMRRNQKQNLNRNHENGWNQI